MNVLKSSELSSVHELNFHALDAKIGNNLLASPRINHQRLWDQIHYTAQWGVIEGSEGMNRLALNEDDKAVRQWFLQEAKTLGCTTATDAMGNLFAVYPGESPDMPPIAMGSHLDTQPAGGKYDGILGVLAALEVIRAVHEAGIKPWCPLAAVVWTNEEGAAFFPGCSGSSVWAGWVPVTDAYAQEHCVTGQTLGAALDEIEAKGTVAASSLTTPLQAHFELHIEQGKILEANQQSIGVVRRIQGIRRYAITCYGRQEHAGTTAMGDRADALVAASKIVLKVEELARARDACATVGVLKVAAPTPNTIPSCVDLTIDARHMEESTLDDLEKQIYNYLEGLSGTNRAWSFSKKRVWHSPALLFDPDLADCISFAAAAEYGQAQVRDMVSLAGHDSAMTALRVPTAMIFVPSQAGISHSPLEFTSMEHCGRGAQTMLNAVLRYDQLCKKRG
ncbi:amidase [Cryphonectria parasitica EP155]|uniref:Amidase n=1 Tax=Cryphonectria parasitica (strain ATCC 38755 / EP155) TaxID=660469 RepID=A0A9P4Y048_CRYP1|nr:amidase [Cryphonectria parasitica EP155]KAF3763947.1 amidase [Cryphonectria parasitica EP155]